MKWISSILVAALLVQVGYVPCAAEEPVTPNAGEIERSKLKVGMYVEVVYYSKNRRKRTITGYIKAVEDDAVIIDRGFIIDRGLWKERIAYRDIIDLTIQEQKALRSKVVPGARIRIVSAGSPPLTGVFRSMDADTLVMKSESGRQLSIPLASSTRLALRLGRKSNVGKGARIGFLVGATSGVILGLMVGETDSGWEGWPSPGEAAGTLGLVFGVLGTAGGALFGLMIREKERWNEVPLPVHLDIQSQRQGGMMLSASFTF